MDIVTFDRSPPRREANFVAAAVAICRECSRNPVAQRFHIEEVDQAAVLSVAHHFLHWRRARADNEAAGRHCLQQ